MARKRHSDEDILKLLREIEVHLASGSDVAAACRTAGISDATYYTWRKKFGGMDNLTREASRSADRRVTSKPMPRI
jgi:putative transposase